MRIHSSSSSFLVILGDVINVFQVMDAVDNPPKKKVKLEIGL